VEPTANPDAVGSLKGQLWSDEPSKVDFLAFQAIAETVADAVMDDRLDPLAIGLSGPWGSGKTTVLELIKLDLDNRSDRDAGKAVLVVRTDPWRYDPATGAKESLISEVLAALTTELEDHATKGSEALKLVKKLAKRVDWAKAIKLAAKTSLALQIPSFDELTELIREKPSEGNDDGEPRGLAAFRTEFASLMASPELAHVRRVAVLVDDLDRCLVDTVVETLEAIRLFLSVDGMAFVIAADEERVADAIRTKPAQDRSDHRSVACAGRLRYGGISPSLAATESDRAATYGGTALGAHRRMRSPPNTWRTRRDPGSGWT
jgi:predicted KAP-like P-loop ATPase